MHAPWRNSLPTTTAPDDGGQNRHVTARPLEFRLICPCTLPPVCPAESNTCPMDIRSLGQHRFGQRLVKGLHDLNARHPWSHNDYFHAWILTQLPDSRRNALDVGCGHGKLLTALSPHFTHVHGTDTDQAIRREASARCAGLPNVTVDAAQLANISQQVDLVTMIAVLHHLDVEAALADVRRILAPGGRFLCVGLAPPSSPADQLWDVASMVANPIIGYAHHPWVSGNTPVASSAPVKDPQLSFNELRTILRRVMPGAHIRRRLGFRHTIEWTQPSPHHF